MLMDRQTKNRQTNGQNYTNFERNLAMMVFCLPVKFEFDWTNQSRNGNFDGHTNGQKTDGITPISKGT